MGPEALAVARILGVQLHRYTSSDDQMELITRSGQLICITGANSFNRSALLGSRAVYTSYASAEWQTDNLHLLVRLLLKAAQRGEVILAAVPLVQAFRIPKWLGSPRHYERVDEHYSQNASILPLILGETKAYSTSLHFDPKAPRRSRELDYESILHQLGEIANPGIILDLGSGWGAFADSVLASTSSKIHCITQNDEQYAFLSGKYALNHRVQVSLHDMMKHEKPCGDITSILMLETIEHIHAWDRKDFFKNLSAHYPDASLLVQFTGTPFHLRLARVARKTAANSLVFPGPGDFPSALEIVILLRQAGYTIKAVTNLSADYERTIAYWLSNYYVASRSGALDEFPMNTRLSWEIYLVGASEAYQIGSVACYRILANA